MARATLLSQLEGGLVVSCQAAPGEPLAVPSILAAMAKAAVAGGAVAIRANRPENIRAIRKAVRVPIIGLYKRDYPDSPVYITATLDDALAVAKAGADIIALDATSRRRPNGVSLKTIVRELRRRTDALLMADIATAEEGIAAAKLGFDFIGTTLSGYTENTKNGIKSGLPDFDLISALRRRLPRGTRIIAEGRIGSPQHAAEALRLGANAVVVGAAITDPIKITRRFCQAIQQRKSAGGEFAIGVDIGGTKTAIALVSATGKVSNKVTVTTPWSQGTKAIAEAVIEGIRSVLKEGGREVKAIGIGATGRVDYARGCVFDGVPLAKDYFGFPLAPTIAKAFDKPVTLENDANAAAYAEYKIGSGRGVQSIACLTIGTGIGGGIVIDGRLLRGHGNAGGFGHMPIVANGRPCRCGIRGCLERYVSRKLMQEELARLVAQGKLSLPRGCESIDTALVMRWIRSRNPVALRVFNAQMDYLAAGLEIVQNTIDPDLVVLSGEISRLGPILTSALRKRIFRPMRITTSRLLNDAGLVGAALLALD